MQQRTPNHLETIKRLTRARRRTFQTRGESNAVWPDNKQDTRDECGHSQDTDKSGKHKEK